MSEDYATIPKYYSDSEVGANYGKDTVSDYLRMKHNSGNDLNTPLKTRDIRNATSTMRNLLAGDTIPFQRDVSIAADENEAKAACSGERNLGFLKPADIGSLEECCKPTVQAKPEVSVSKMVQSERKSPPSEKSSLPAKTFTQPFSVNREKASMEPCKRKSTPNDPETASPYRVLEDLNKQKEKPPNETLLGEPRCLTLKKQDDMTLNDYLELDFAELSKIDFDEQESNSEKPEQPSVVKKPAISTNTTKPNPNDMFVDDDDGPNERGGTKKIPYISLLSPEKNRAGSHIEKEEGELTPDLYSIAKSDGNKTKVVRKPEKKESNQEFFLKINRCFRQLEKEFSNMHVPSGSRRMVGQLQNTLCNAIRMTRKLSFLIDSARNNIRSQSKAKATPNSDAKNNRTSSRDKSSVSVKSSENNTDKTNLQGSGSKASEVKGAKRSSHTDKNVDNRMKPPASRTQHKDEGKSEHTRRTDATIVHLGTKEEKQRIQSLFKRQMNLINQHVIQKNDPGKRKKDSEKAADAAQKAKGIQTLQEMEDFFKLLKSRKGQVTTPKAALAKERKKKYELLRFSTKKGKDMGKRVLPVVLTGAEESEAIKPSGRHIVECTKSEKHDVKVICEKSRQLVAKILKNGEGYNMDKLLNAQLEKCETKTQEIPKTKIQRSRESEEVKDTSSVKRKETAEETAKEIECRKEKKVTTKREIEPSTVKRNSKDIECKKGRSTDFVAKPREEIVKSSKRRKKSEESVSCSESSTSRSESEQELATPVLKKRKRNELNKESLPVERKIIVPSQKSRNRRDSEEDIDEKLPVPLKSKKLYIVGDKDLALLDKQFCLKVKGNQIFLKKMEEPKKTVRKQRIRNSRSGDSIISVRSSQGRKKYKINLQDKHPNPERAAPTLKEMEEFLQQLRAKKKVLNDEQQEFKSSNQQTREMKFMARIQAQRKAKLMACATVTQNITEKEVKFLKDLENHARDPSDSPETEKKKQKLMQKIRAETDAIVLSQKQNSKNSAEPSEEDPLSDVKNFLSMIKEAESNNEETSKQVYVSFSLKKSDVKQLENITTGDVSSLSEESQKFLNSVRAKIRAKKASGFGTKEAGE